VSLRPLAALLLAALFLALSPPGAALAQRAAALDPPAREAATAEAADSGAPIQETDLADQPTPVAAPAASPQPVPAEETQAQGAPPNAPAEEAAAQPPPEKTSKEVDVPRTVWLLPSKIVTAPLNLFQTGVKGTLNYLEGEHIVDKVLYYVRRLNDEGIFPNAYNMGDDSGTGIGLEVRRSPDRRFCLGAAGGVTNKLYQQYQLSAALPLYESEVMLMTRAGYRYRPQEEFYGIGPDSSNNRRSDYLLEDWFAEGSTRVGCWRGLQGALAVRYDSFKTAGGTDSGVASTTSVFSPFQAPGLGSQIDLFSAGFTVVHDDRDWPEVPTRGGRQLLTAALFRDTGGQHFNFYRATLDLQQLLPFSTLKHAFLVRAYAEVNQPAGSDDEVPFFLLATLGGSELLRGFHTLRFYDEKAVEWSVEYIWRIWSRADAFLYVDQGEVFGRRQGFSAGDIATSGGGGFRVRAFGWEHSEDVISGGPGFVSPNERLFFQILIGGSVDGVQPFVTFGAFL
jgi:hypothetical protein